MPARVATPAVLLLVAALALPARAADRKPPSIYQSKRLWATVNVCDTAKYPDDIGLRASMPGSGRKAETMYVRFQVQYRSTVDGKWHNVASGGDSGFISLGPATYRRRETGRTYTVPPPAGGTLTLRGAVTFEWRKDGEVVRHARKQTEAGHPTSSKVKTDPSGFSAATCVVKS